MAYATVAQAKAVKTIVGKSDADYQEALDWAVELIDSITKDHFVPVTKTVRVSGSGSRRLNLYPIEVLSCLSLSSVTDIPTGDVITLTDIIIRKHYLEIVTTTESEGGVRALSFLAGIFPKGNSNVEVTGSFGWTACPSAIKRCAILLALSYLSAASSSAIAGAMSSESIGDYSYSKADPKIASSINTGISEVDVVLARYINKFIGISAV